jgi:hypothetical protein
MHGRHQLDFCHITQEQSTNNLIKKRISKTIEKKKFKVLMNKSSRTNYEEKKRRTEFSFLLLDKADSQRTIGGDLAHTHWMHFEATAAVDERCPGVVRAATCKDAIPTPSLVHWPKDVA